MLQQMNRRILEAAAREVQQPASGEKLALLSSSAASLSACLLSVRLLLVVSVSLLFACTLLRAAGRCGWRCCRCRRRSVARY